MSNVVLDVTLSLDGYMAGPNVAVATPMGDGGERLHAWMFADDAPEQDRSIVRAARDNVGAVVLGRRTFDVGIGMWNDTPYPAPSFVLTRRPPPAEVPQRSGTFHFEQGDVTDVLRRARVVADGRKVMLMGGDVSRQALAARQVDELHLHLVPETLGRGLRLFDPDNAPGLGSSGWQCIATVASPRVTHLRYRALRG